MSGDLMKYGGNDALTVTSEHIETLKSTIAVGATDPELELFIHFCQKSGVHPLDKMIHFVKRGSGDNAKATFQASIDYLRSQAQDSGEYNGQDEPVFEYEEGTQYPIKATVAVYRKGIDKPFVGVARWKEFYPSVENLGFQWRKMPEIMLAKCAEAQALRKAFPKKFAQLYTPEEMAQAEAGPVAQTSKTDSVQPALPSDENVVDAEFEEVDAEDLQPVEEAPAEKVEEVKLTPQETLRKEILIHIGLDGTKAKAVLKTVSEFKGSDDKMKFATNPMDMKDKWAGTALKKLRELVKKEGPAQPMPEGCAADPGACDHSTYTDKAFCTKGKVKDTPCPWGIGKTY